MSSTVESLFKDGVLVELHVKRWSGAAPLLPGDIDKKKLPKAFRLGRKLLVDPATLAGARNIELRARYYIEQSSFRFPVSGARFVPVKALPDLLERVNQEKQEFFQWVDTYDYEKAKREWLEANEDVRDKLLPHYPEERKVKSSFDWSLEMFQLSEWKHVSKEDASILAAQWNRAVSELIQGVVDDLKGVLLGACSNLVAKLQGGEVVNPRTLASARQSLEKFRTLNWIGIQELDQEISLLHSLLQGLNAPDLAREDAREALRMAAVNLAEQVGKISDVSAIEERYVRSTRTRNGEEAPRASLGLATILADRAA
jgi:hypothetical protein